MLELLRLVSKIECRNLVLIQITFKHAGKPHCPSEGRLPKLIVKLPSPIQVDFLNGIFLRKRILVPFPASGQINYASSSVNPGQCGTCYQPLKIDKITGPNNERLIFDA